jgi:hypothetical protein
LTNHDRPSSSDRSSEQVEPLYVGYRGLSAQQRRSLMVIVPALIGLLVFIAAGIAISQRNPGDGTWDQTVVERTGVIYASPVPMLWMTESPALGGNVVLLVEEGKHGAQQRARAWDAKSVTIRATTLRRGERMMFELVAGDTAIRALPQTAESQRPEHIAGDQTTLRGEIVDAKCYFGAMKPGDGKTHKACATLCVGNGIPAVLVVAVAGIREAYLVLTPDGSQLDADTLSKIGEPVEVRGFSGMLGDMKTITVAPGSVLRTGR